jgi:hypothetical protein
MFDENIVLVQKNGILSPGDQFHLGIVTADPQGTMVALTEALGYQWGAWVGSVMTVALPGGAKEVELTCVFSVTEPRLELVRAVPDTLWEPVAGAGIHHLGYWSDDVAGDVAALTEHGWEVEATRPFPDGGLFFAFLAGAKGFRIELVNRRIQPSMQVCWTP